MVFTAKDVSDFIHAFRTYSKLQKINSVFLDLVADGAMGRVDGLRMPGQDKYDRDILNAHELLTSAGIKIGLSFEEIDGICISVDKLREKNRTADISDINFTRDGKRIELVDYILEKFSEAKVENGKAAVGFCNTVQRSAQTQHVAASFRG